MELLVPGIYIFAEAEGLMAAAAYYEGDSGAE